MAMKNRAKCKKCKSIIESFHRYDYVTCSCGEIAVDGGEDNFRCIAKNWDSFLRVDDEGNEIMVTVKDKEEPSKPIENVKPNKKELLDMLEEMIKSYETLPEHALHAPVSHSDLVSSLILLSAILRADCKDVS